MEEEIQTLRHVLANKIRVSQELKRKLGISVWKEITDDMNQGLKNVKESQVYVFIQSCRSTYFFLYLSPSFCTNEVSGWVFASAVTRRLVSSMIYSTISSLRI